MMRTEMYQEEQFLTKYFVRKHLQLLVILSMMDIREDSSQWFTTFLTSNLKTLVLTQELFLRKLACNFNNLQVQQLADELHKFITRKFKKHKVY